MTNTKKPAPTTGSASQDTLGALLGPTLILEGEDVEAFEELRAKFYADVAPTDILEEVWVNTCVDLFWTKLRLSRLKIKFLQSSAHEGLLKILNALVPGYGQRDLSHAWQRREPDKLDRVKTLLKQAGLDEEAITAQTFIARLDELEKLERVIAGAEARFNKCLQEISRHRDAIARRIGAVSQEITDTEFADVSPQKLAAAE